MDGPSASKSGVFAVIGLVLWATLLAQNPPAIEKTFPSVPIAGTQLRKITSAVVHQEYLIRVRIPDDYERTNKRYPVLYLLDGDHAFAMATDIVQYLEYGSLPELIIVSPAYGSKEGPGSGGTNMRDRDLRFPGAMVPGEAGGDKYLRFLADELIPYVDSNFRTLPDDRTLWGYSLGATFALQALFHEPALFKRYVIIDGFGVDIPELERAFADRNAALPVRLYLASAVPNADLLRFSETLRKRNYKGLDVQYADMCGVRHVVVGGEGLARGLQAVFGKLSIYEALLHTITAHGIQAAIAQYADLKTNRATDYDFSESELSDLGDALIRMDRLQDAIAILTLNVQNYPSSANAFYDLATAYRRSGDPELAARNYRKVLALNPKSARAAWWLEHLAATRQ